ncbi:MAG: HPr-rel-A system PqqD family peptide chaperone [Candidatus Competibacter sp.]|nr:HPr-rel-A system PqqD family peptide chaperone [Candidatus Competibacter sp.]MDS4070892.1 HPr-rel-A system PqqD family peptide chaperone [Candidatus Competibacter sp.]
MPFQIKPIYRCNLSGNLHWRKWDSEEYVIFNAASGQTHFLNILGFETLMLLQKKPLNIFELGRQLSLKFEDFLLDEETQTYIENMLVDLDNLGLVEVCFL